ncbi:hypothetical protein [Actinophytocola sp.]|uniref:hypothetical protein n=1 Tax=Actinophytocola sp. TaxID=1872138 RepID=UPI003D6C6073
MPVDPTSNTGGVDVWAAIQAAELRPGADSGGLSARSGGDRAGAYIGLATFMIGSLGMFGWVLTQSRGWLLVLAGIPPWLAIRWLMPKMRGMEFGTITVADRGVVHVVSGRHAVRRMQRMFDLGVSRWTRHAWIGGLAIGVLGPIGLAMLFVVLDSPLPVVVFLTCAGFGMLNLARLAVVRRLRVQSSRGRLLDASTMLPALALYARHHGWRAATSGVPADRVAATFAAHPAEISAAREYQWRTELMSSLAEVPFPGRTAPKA